MENLELEKCLVEGCNGNIIIMYDEESCQYYLRCDECFALHKFIQLKKESEEEATIIKVE